MRYFGVLVVVLVGCAAGEGNSSGSGRGVQVGDGMSGTGGGMMAAAGAMGGTTGVGVGGMGGGSGDDGMLKPVEKDVMEGEECTGIEQMAKNEKQPVDIIWAVDNSPSMSFVIGAMEQEMNKLVTTVTAADIDVHIVMISEAGGLCIQPPVAGAGCASNPPTFQHLTTCGGDSCWVGSHNALGRLIQAYPDYKMTIRQNSLKYFGAVTDDTAYDNTNYAANAAMFTSQVEALEPGWFDDWKFFGIISPILGGTYQMLADQTGGMTGQVGLGQDYTALFNMLAQTVTEEVKLDCAWDIPEVPPEAGEFDQHKVNFSYTPGDGSPSPEILHVDSSADCGMDQGWYYDNNDGPTKVEVCPATCATIQPDLMGKVQVLFGCSTIQRPD